VKKPLVAGLVVAVVVALGVAAVPLAEEYSARQIKANLEADGATTVDSVEVGLFSRRVTFHKLHARRAGDVSIGRWEASALSWPLGELLQGHTPFAGLQLGDPVQAGHVEITDMRITDESASWTIGSLTIDGLDLERYDTTGLGPMQFAPLAMRIARALSIKKFEQKQTVYVAPFTADRVAIADLTVENFDHGRIGSLAMTGLAATPKAATAPVFTMAEFKVAGLDLSRPLKALSSPAWRPGRPIGRIGIDKASAAGFGGEGLARYGVSLGTITTQSTHESPGVTRTQTRVDGFVLAPPLTGLQAIQTRLVLKSMGLNEVRLGFDCLGREDRPKAEVVVERCALSGPDLADIVLSAKLVKADDAFWKAVDDGDGAAFIGTKAALGGAKLVIADKGLLERTLKAVATTSGRTPAEMRSLVAKEVRQFQPAGVLITEDLTKLLDTVARFIESGGTLTVEAKPDPPLGLDRVNYFRIPGPDWVSLLGLSATLSR
jgi:hypothetical protein